MSRNPEHDALLQLDLDGIQADGWRRLVRGAADRRSPLRTPVLATLDGQGRPAARTVVLREAQPARRVLVAHSDARAGKMDGLRRSPWAEWVFWDPRARIQLRARGPVTPHHRDDLAADHWRRAGPHTRRGYTAAPAPGTPSPSPTTGLDPSREDPAQGWANFVVLVCAVRELEWLLLARAGHRRAQVSYDDDGGQIGRWLVP